MKEHLEALDSHVGLSGLRSDLLRLGASTLDGPDRIEPFLKAALDE